MYLHKQTSNEKKTASPKPFMVPFTFCWPSSVFFIQNVICLPLWWYFVLSSKKHKQQQQKKRYQIWIFSWLICVHHSEGPNNPLYGIWPKKVRERSYWTILEMVSNRHSLYPISFPIVQMVLSLSFRCHSFDMKQILIVFLSIC